MTKKQASMKASSLLISDKLPGALRSRDPYILSPLVRSMQSESQVPPSFFLAGGFGFLMESQTDIIDWDSL